ncbi:hypothetical protein PG984_013758 [Apiospora sp. TS-2023a]
MGERPTAGTKGVDMTTTDSTLLKLPVEIILMILQNIHDTVSILVLRQTCRLLRSLCEDDTLELKVPTVASQQEATPWFDDPYLKLVCSLPDDELAQYEQLLWKDRMCHDCKELRRDADSYGRTVRPDASPTTLPIYSRTLSAGRPASGVSALGVRELSVFANMSGSTMMTSRAFPLIS